MRCYNSKFVYLYDCQLSVDKLDFTLWRDLKIVILYLKRGIIIKTYSVHMCAETAGGFYSSNLFLVCKIC